MYVASDFRIMEWEHWPEMVYKPFGKFRLGRL